MCLTGRIKGDKKMTTIYFVRHAESNYANHDGANRELTSKGLKDRMLVTEYLKDKNIDIVLSSPYKRAIDTVKHFADTNNHKIEIIDDFRERKIDSVWIEDFNTFCKNQWDDFTYKLYDGENLFEVQERNIRALNYVLEKYRDKKVVIGSHGIALSTVINYFDNTFGYYDFLKIKSLMPWLVKFTFCNKTIQEIEMVDLFSVIK